MVKGWKNESRRHSLASKGIKTAQKIPSLSRVENSMKQWKKDKFFMEEQKKEELKTEYKNLLNRDIEDSAIGIENIRVKRRMEEIENIFKDLETKDKTLKSYKGKISKNPNKRSLDEIIKKKFVGYSNQRLVDKANRDFKNNKNTDDVDFEIARRKKLGLINTKVGFDTIELIEDKNELRDKPYYQEGKLSLRNDGGQTPPPQ